MWSGKEITLIYGGIPVAWNILTLSIVVARSTSTFMQNEFVFQAGSSVTNINSIGSFRLSYLEADPKVPLVDLVFMYRRSQATKPEDKINAFLGISRDCGVPVVQPNYRRSMREVYTCMVQLALETGSFHSFCISGLSNGKHGNGLSGLPSWLPNLTKPPLFDTYHYHERGYKAGA
jgi:hypothetical protein